MYHALPGIGKLLNHQVLKLEDQSLHSAIDAARSSVDGRNYKNQLEDVSLCNTVNRFFSENE